MDDGLQGKKGNALRALKAVFWAFLGIRRGDAARADLASLKPWQVMVAGVIGAALFVTVIVSLVRMITR
ncbi:MAG: DUF2970 domain-containing protein [Gammaproteobacteria bacterium]